MEMTQEQMRHYLDELSKCSPEDLSKIMGSPYGTSGSSGLGKPRKEKKIGMFRLVDNELGGVTFYPQLGYEDTGVWYMLTGEAVEQLKEWLNNEN
jgi:hypothetical protein